MPRLLLGLEFKGLELEGRRPGVRIARWLWGPSFVVLSSQPSEFREALESLQVFQRPSTNPNGLSMVRARERLVAHGKCSLRSYPETRGALAVGVLGHKAPLGWGGGF